MEEVVTLQLEAPLALVTLNRPKSLNALNSEVYRQLIAILRRVEGMDDIKAVILTGAGDKAFAAGADIAQMVHEDSMAARRLSGLCHEAAGLLENMRQVTIAAVNGYALGGGCSSPWPVTSASPRSRPGLRCRRSPWVSSPAGEGPSGWPASSGPAGPRR